MRQPNISLCTNSMPRYISSTTIHDLPEALVVHILSLLPIQDAILTSLVSRKFRNLWHLMPSLHLDLSNFYSPSIPRTEHEFEFRQLFADFVSHALLLRPNYPLTKFVLKFNFNNFNHQKYFVQNWIRHAISLSVSVLTLSFAEDTLGEDDMCYNFHLSDIEKGCVKALRLYQCCLILPPKTSPIRFASLKSLELEFVDLNSNTVCNLLACCVNLETLELISIQFDALKGLRIYSATLKELCFRFCWNISDDDFDLDICCPSLHKLGLINVDIGKYIIKDTTLLVEAQFDIMPYFRYEDYNQSWERILRCCSNISSLQLWDEVLESNEVPVRCEQFASNIKHLELCIAYNENDLVGLAALLKLFPKLEILGLRYRVAIGTNDPKLDKDYWGASIVFNMRCLRKVILRDYHKSEGEQHFIELFRQNSVMLEKIELLHI